jgi:hypothetical protein
MVTVSLSYGPQFPSNQPLNSHPGSGPRNRNVRAVQFQGGGIMKFLIGTVVLALLASSPLYGQDPDKEKDKPKPAQQEPKPKEEPKKAPEKDKQQEQQAHKPQQDAAKKQEQRAAKEQQDAQKQAQKQQEKNEKAQEQTDKDRTRQEHKAQEQARRQEANPSQAQRDGGARNVRRIDERTFHSHFGREHTFHVERRDDRRFHYGGYWFEYTEAWPADWSYDDDVYVDEIDGEYYLIDPVHPGIRIVVIVVG